jgi:hypothetical protein
MIPFHLLGGALPAPITAGRKVSAFRPSQGGRGSGRRSRDEDEDEMGGPALVSPEAARGTHGVPHTRRSSVERRPSRLGTRTAMSIASG